MQEGEAQGDSADSADMSRLPRYRPLPKALAFCHCDVCQAKAAEHVRLDLEHVSAEAEASEFASAFAADVRAVCSLAGHLHEHQSTCFKYAPEGSRRKPQHCRFNFTLFVELQQQADDGSVKPRLVARTGKEPVLPMWPGDPLPACEGTGVVDGSFRGAGHSGQPCGDVGQERQQRASEDCAVQPAGRAMSSSYLSAFFFSVFWAWFYVLFLRYVGTVGFFRRFEFHSMRGWQVGMAAHRGNLNYQDCRQTLTDGFEADGVDFLRQAAWTARVLGFICACLSV